MSVYSGFATRKQEKDYNCLLKNMFGLIMDQLAKQIQAAKMIFDYQYFTQSFTDILTKIKDMEDHKYLPPKYSPVLESFNNRILYIYEQTSKKQNLTNTKSVQLGNRRVINSSQQSARTEIKQQNGIPQYLDETPKFSMERIRIHSYQQNSTEETSILNQQKMMPLRQKLNNKSSFLTRYQKFFAEHKSEHEIKPKRMFSQQ